MAPFAQTGGLADVAGALPLALGKLGVEMAILMPRTRGILFSKKKLAENVTIYFVENEAYFNRHSLYGNNSGDYPDNLERFSFFCHQALELSKEIGFKPDLIHAHDWQTALLPVLLKTKYLQDPFFKKTKSILTIHNLAYQGVFPHRLYPELKLDPGLFQTEIFEFYGKINLLKAGLFFADRLSTVSPSYADEIKTKEFGFGLEGVIQKRGKDLRGILNGIDTKRWDPARDRLIKKRFQVSDHSGKAQCKAQLQRLAGFEVNPAIPLFGMVSRLAEQKGMDIISEMADRFLSKNVQWILLGEGDAVYQTTFRNIGHRHRKNAAMYLRFDEPKAHEIYAGSDFFLMPSYFEPCGLGQMISLRYGTLPIVRRTGGLADTVRDIEEDRLRGNGLVFESRSPEALLKTTERATQLFENKKYFQMLQRRVMRYNFSWEKSAKEYKKFYAEVVK